jgi:hypothetical protein
LQQYPAFPKALTLCAVIQLNDKQWGAAEQNLQAAVRDPAYPPAYVVLGDPYNKEVRFDGALAMTERAVALIPGCCAGREVARPGREDLSGAALLGIFCGTPTGHRSSQLRHA